MTEQVLRSSGRPNRFNLPAVVGGLLICALIAAAVAPLVGADRGERVGTTTPEFLAGTETAEGGVAATPPTGPGGLPLSGGPSAGSAASGTATGPASGSSPDGGSADATAADGAAPSEARTASDIGVTEDTIRIGAMTLQCNQCAAFGVGVGAEGDASHAQIAQAFIDEINGRGGINGRQLELFTAGYDPVADSVSGGGTQRAACIDLTERRQVFAVIMGAFGDNGCVHTEHGTPMLHALDFNADDPETFNESEGRLWLLGATSARVLLDWARQLDGQQLLTPSTKWGLLTDESSEPMVRQYLLAELERLGYSPTHVTVLSADPGSAAVKTAQEVPVMRSKGVTDVLLATNFVAQGVWVNEAQRNGWRPQYLVSDFPSPADDFSGGTVNASGGWAGAIAVSSSLELTPAQWREHPVAGPCIEVFERNSGRTATLNDIGWIINYCTNLLNVFVPAMSRAGANPTRQSLVQALAGLGEFPMATLGNVGTFGGPYSLGSVKWSATDFGQRKVWQSPCPREGDSDNACYVPVGPVYRMAA